MSKIILMMLLAVVSSSTVAEWVYVTENDSMSAYANPTTIRKVGNKVKMWDMYSYNAAITVSDTTYLSTKKQTEYDCKEEQSRTLTYSMHSENMGGGTVVHFNDKPLEWVPISPESMGASLWKFACGKPPIPVVNNSAMKDWVKVGDATYADPATIRKAGNKVKMWTLFDYQSAEKTIKDKSYMSLKSQYEYDCKEDQIRGLSRSMHSENMGGGNIIYRNAEPLAWLSAPLLGGSWEAMLKFACKKR